MLKRRGGCGFEAYCGSKLPSLSLPFHMNTSLENFWVLDFKGQKGLGRFQLECSSMYIERANSSRIEKIPVINPGKVLDYSYEFIWLIAA